MLGEQIRRAREAKGFSQRDLATRAGVSRKHLSDFENGANVSVDVVGRVARALGLRELKIAGLRLVEDKDSSVVDTRLLSESASRIANEAQRLLRHVRGGAATAPEPDIEEQAPSEPDAARTVRIYLVEDDREHEAWRKRLIDFASRSDQLAWREGRHTPAKYHSPLQGNVAAGHGADIQPVDDEDLRQIPDYYWEKRGARFALRVYGQSLERRGIFEHDLVYVRPTEGEEPRENSIVIAEIDTQIVCKIWRRVKGKALLYSASPAFPKPIDPSRYGHFAVKGVVVGRSGDTQEAEAD